MSYNVCLSVCLSVCLPICTFCLPVSTIQLRVCDHEMTNACLYTKVAGVRILTLKLFYKCDRACENREYRQKLHPII